jgi:hypothetical protein
VRARTPDDIRTALDTKDASVPRHLIPLLPGSLLTLAAVAIAGVYTANFGRLFGAWDWAAMTFVLLVIELLGLLTFGNLLNESNPTLRRWDMQRDPQAEFPLAGAPPGVNAQPLVGGWLLSLALQPLLATLLLWVYLWSR